jgi:PKD repeat protein
MPEFVDTLCEKLAAITAAAPECDFTASPRRGMAPLRVSFTDLSTGTVTDWEWDFGDDGTSTVQNPTHTYTVAGIYDVTLMASGPGGSCTETKNNYIIVTAAGAAVAPEPPKLVAAWLLVSPEQVLPNQEVQISINIGNQGGSEGSRTVALFINGYLEQSQTVVVSAGSSQNVVFRVTKSTPGTYEVSLEGKEGRFFVIAPAEAQTTNYFAGPLGTGGIIVIVVIAIVLIVAIVFLLRRQTA